MIHLVLPANVNDLILFKQKRKVIADCFIDCSGSQAASHNENHWFVDAETAEIQTGQPVAVKEFFADRGTA